MSNVVTVCSQDGRNKSAEESLQKNILLKQLMSGAPGESCGVCGEREGRGVIPRCSQVDHKVVNT